MGLQVLLDSRVQLGDALEHTAANAVLGNQAEKAFDLMDPRGGGRGEVHVKARMPFEPGLNLGVLVGGVAVGDQVHGEVLRCFSIDAAQEFELAASIATPCAPVATIRPSRTLDLMRHEPRA